MPEYVEILKMALVDMWLVIMGYLPKIAIAIVLLIGGIVLANILKTAVIRVVRLLRIDEMLDQLDVKKIFDRASINLDIAEFLGWISKWVVIIMALIAIADVLDWDQITVFLASVVSYVPNVLIAVVILLVGLLVGNVIENIIRGAVKVTKVKSAVFLAGIAKWSIMIFSAMAALVQLGIAEALIQTLFTGFVVMVALAGGLAFGLGGKDHAKKILDLLEDDLKSGK